MWEWIKDFFTVKDFFGQAVTGLAAGLLNVVAQDGTPQDLNGWVLVAASVVLGASSKSAIKK